MQKKLRKGQLEDHEFEQLNAKIGKLAEAPIFIDDTPALSIFELRAKARRLHQQHGIRMIVVDYPQLMTAGGDNRNGKPRTGNQQHFTVSQKYCQRIEYSLSLPSPS